MSDGKGCIWLGVISNGKYVLMGLPEHSHNFDYEWNGVRKSFPVLIIYVLPDRDAHRLQPRLQQT